jgi:hypothetical protein
MRYWKRDFDDGTGVYSLYRAPDDTYFPVEQLGVLGWYRDEYTEDDFIDGWFGAFDELSETDARAVVTRLREWRAVVAEFDSPVVL